MMLNKISSLQKVHLIGIALCIFYAVGLIGFQVEDLSRYFIALTPWHLWLSALLLLLAEPPYSKSKLAWFALVFLYGFGIEWLGVKTGVVFGSYEYGATLGIQLDHIPITIGINWVLLAFASHDLSHRVSSKPWLATIIASVLMVVLDWFIEPVAVALDFWHWENGQIPSHNFIGWFWVSLLLFGCTNLARLKWKNDISVYLYLCMLVFFIGLRFTVASSF